jgi:hypothetical protein
MEVCMELRNRLKRIFGNTDDEALFDIAAAAQITGASKSGLYSATSDGRVRATKITAARRRVKLSDVREALRQGIIYPTDPDKQAAARKATKTKAKTKTKTKATSKATSPKLAEGVTAHELAQVYGLTVSGTHNRLQRHRVEIVRRTQGSSGGRASILWHAAQAHAEMKVRRSTKAAKPAVVIRPIDAMIDAIAGYEKAVQRTDKLAAYARIRDTLLELGRELENGQRDEIRNNRGDRDA